MRRQTANKAFSPASHHYVDCSVGFFLHRHILICTHACIYFTGVSGHHSFYSSFNFLLHVLSCKVLSLIIPQPLRCGSLWGGGERGCKSVVANKKSLKLWANRKQMISIPECKLPLTEMHERIITGKPAAIFHPVTSWITAITPEKQAASPALTWQSPLDVVVCTKQPYSLTGIYSFLCLQTDNYCALPQACN